MCFDGSHRTHCVVVVEMNLEHDNRQLSAVDGNGSHRNRLHYGIFSVFDFCGSEVSATILIFHKRICGIIFVSVYIIMACLIISVLSM